MAYLRRRLYRRLRRGYRPSRRVRLSYRSRKSIRKDLQKLGFPNKVKLIGMTQKRSFLLRSDMVTVDIAAKPSEGRTLLDGENLVLYTLDPREAANWNINIGTGTSSRYQLFTVKKIYIRVTPCANSFPSNTTSLSQLRMSYHMYSYPGVTDQQLANDLSEQSAYKDEYQFASNKSITFVIKRPRPFFPSDVMLGSSRSEVSISALGPKPKTETRDGYGDYDDEDENVNAYNSKDFNYGSIVFAGPAGTKFNVQISYKVTVKN